jgi:N-acetylneuraminic acid mutarotase
VIDNKIYVVGGQSSVTLESPEIFDPATNAWSIPQTTGTFTGRQGLCAGVSNGKIYAIGGFDGFNYLSTVEEFDPATSAWSTPVTSGTFTARAGLSACDLNGAIYVMGGRDQKGFIKRNEVFTPAPLSVRTELPNSLLISPNPTSGIVTVSSRDENILSVSVVDIFGRELIRYPQLQSTSVTLDLTTVGSGGYYLKVNTPSSAIIRIVIKK